MRTDQPQTIYLKDYKIPPYKVKHVDLDFKIYNGHAIVTGTTQYIRNPGSTDPLLLNGEDVELQSVKLNGADIAYEAGHNSITVKPAVDEFTLEIVTKIEPEKNTMLMGLYKSGTTYCTQCESEGFRRMTYYQDRPDVMSTFRVRLETDKSFPVQLSNGNLIEQGDAAGNRHYTIWDDPTPKPCYLFAIVAGDLARVEDAFTTMSGRKVDLFIYVKKGDEPQCGHAMRSLQKSMKWDEDVYGREYQYDLFNIVAISDYNMGAMENTSLNIFNTALVLAHPDTATDADFIRVEAVIAHEYFHNWSGNRVTCRDWFQLSLKEGLTVYRENAFAGDMNSKTIQRIDDVQSLRRMQFPEDAGPLAHPIRPDNYMEISNFYTMTVYEKGAEVIGMFHTLLGDKTYRKATDLYFDRFDGMAVTTDDWVQCMEDASGLDLSQFKLWYSQAGTPEIDAKGHYDEKAKTYTLTLTQHVPPTPGQPLKKPMHMPISVGLVGPNGDDLIGTQILQLTEGAQQFTFENIGSKPVPSILRNFSAPVKLTTDLTDEDLQFLMVHDSDGFNRWEAGQAYSMRVINNVIDGGEIDVGLLESLENLLDQALQGKGDKALLARALTLPDIQIIAQTRDIVDPDAIYKARESVKRALLGRAKEKIVSIYKKNMENGPYNVDSKSMAKRSLKNVMLDYIADPVLAGIQYASATNMTDRVGALSILKDHEGGEKDAAFADFYNRFKTYPLVVDKWFALQSGAVNDSVAGNIRKLISHPDFTLLNPNRARSVYGAFSMNNPVGFHRADGSGYMLLKDAVISLNTLNPQIASRLLTPLREWRRYTPDRQAKMKAVLEDVLKQEKLSPDVFEIVSKSLKA